MNSPELYSLDRALKAQKALRQAAGVAPEQFPVQAFVPCYATPEEWHPEGG